jgi:hypothetical protein
MTTDRSALFLGATGMAIVYIYICAYVYCILQCLIASFCKKITGAVGKTLLIDLLKSGTFKTITTIGRREFEYNGPNKEALVCINALFYKYFFFTY